MLGQERWNHPTNCCHRSVTGCFRGRHPASDENPADDPLPRRFAVIDVFIESCRRDIPLPGPGISSDCVRAQQPPWQLSITSLACHLTRSGIFHFCALIAVERQIRRSRCELANPEQAFWIRRAGTSRRASLSRTIQLLQHPQAPDIVSSSASDLHGL